MGQIDEHTDTELCPEDDDGQSTDDLLSTESSDIPLPSHDTSVLSHDSSQPPESTKIKELVRKSINKKQHLQLQKTRRKIAKKHITPSGRKIGKNKRNSHKFAINEFLD